MTASPRVSSRPGAGHVVADQGEVAAFLARPETHGVETVERIDTHGAMVFLAGDKAYKVKRAVAYPYMDFSTLERRRKACVKEVAINRRTAPRVYLGVCAVRRSPEGVLVLGGEGAVVEWVVVMRRFDQEGLFDRLAQNGRLTPDLLRALADEIVCFHGRAERVKGETGDLGWVIEENTGEFAERPDLFAPDRARALTAASRKAFEEVGDLLDDRWARGLVRRCHGDLHLRNICLIEGQPTLFDAVEFNDQIATVDVFYDLAFLLMDLDHRGLRPAANLVLNRYLQAAMDDLEVLAALPLFLSLRAAVRAKVSASAAQSQDDAAARARLEAEARDYFAAAERYLAPPRPRLLAVGGFSGSGKSSLARALAPDIGAPPGALVLRSDVLRKQLYGVDELTPLPAAAYRPRESRRVYRSLLEHAATALQAGQAVVLDAVYDRPESRAAAEALAHKLGVPFTGIWLDAPREVLTKRAAARRGDASDATPAVVLRQLQEDPGEIAWHRVDGSGSLEQSLAAARRLVAD